MKVCIKGFPLVDCTVYRRVDVEALEGLYILIALICIFWMQGALGGSFAI
jgi:hypothetical protein